ncbi:MAG TPA: OstA-like protein [Bacteroidia bacterium]|nr:OstA-like protein [Bacteroidia bacterium]
MKFKHSDAVTLAGFVFGCVGLFSVTSVFSQRTEQVEIINANTFEGDERLGKNVARLTGDVQFRHKGVLMFCDSAYLYQETNSLDAFGHIRIQQGDSIRLTGNLLKYYGDTRIATVFGNVQMNDRSMVLTTENMTYDMSHNSALYETTGTIVDRENRLVSKSGYYHSDERMLFFKDSVVLTNPDYIMRSDTLKYNTVTKTAWFFGPTTITSTGSDSSFIYCRLGWYDTNKEKSLFRSGAYIRSKESKLSGDSLLFDRNQRLGEAFGNVALSDTVNKIIIAGNYGWSNDNTKHAFVTGKALMTKIFDTDSLFLHADSLFAYEDTITKVRTWNAWKNVRFFKSDLQGKCDSLEYSTVDSLVKLNGNPVLWSDSNQLTATFISIQIANKEVSRLYLNDDAFIVSREDSIRYNQIKGRKMTGFFEENQLSVIHVEGNGQSVYYTRNNKKQLSGVNRADCSDMVIGLDSSKVASITLLNEPDATLYPIQELSPNELRLKGFLWNDAERPLSAEDVFRKP